ncbi:50S ribosomal protein L4 [Candidatus Vidania fulgoroideorum]
MIYFRIIKNLDLKNIKNYTNMYLSNLRLNISSQKNRSKVSYSGKKPWNQKGTGKARSGSKSSPIWRGGGRAFPNTNKDNYKKKINKKFFKYCYKNSFLFFLKKKIFFFKKNIFEFSTKKFIKFIKELNILDKKILFIGSFNKSFLFSGRNIKNFLFLELNYLNPYYIINYDKILIDYKNFIYLYSYFNDI